ncbi:MAG TPA: cation:dicarboxylase symporter family transporter, partial [Candidatus Acidoferrales bacterium]|nr:cation:dicarboxylase symporter family transporter [Candidatus Acidoferrales bacterium]
MRGAPPKAPDFYAMSFSKRILTGMTTGVAVGLFFGELVSPLKIVADGFVKLLQMTVLPFLIISIISSLGSLTYADARRLGLRVGVVMAGMWALALTFALLMPLAFPPTQHATFFSNAMVEHRPPFNFLDLYIPSNPFNSLANNVVPAVVLFAMFLGIALIGAPRKQQLLDVLDVASEMLSRATRFVVRLTPFGVFAICAHSAGTLSVDQLGQIQIYLITYAAIALLLAFWVLPGLVAALTPIPLWDIFASNRDALLTAFIAGDLFIVLPSLTEACGQILLRHRVAKEGEHNLPEIIVPASFNFPHSAKMLSLSFILFAGWFANVVVS